MAFTPLNCLTVLGELAAQDPLVTVINHTRNFGSQSAFTSGMMLATGDAVVLLDGDLQDPPELIEEFYYKWQEGYDVVYGIRVKREGSLLRRIAYKIFYRIFQKMSYIKIPLDAGDFSLMDRRVVNALNEMPERDRFLRGLRAWVGYRQKGIEYVRAERQFGESTNSFLDNTRWARRGIFSFSYVPLEFITYLALFIVCLSFLGVAAQIVLRFVLPDVPSGFSTVIVLILFMGGIQLLCLSIMGEYLGRMFEEVKHRPKFLIKNIINHPDERLQDSEDQDNG